MVAKTVSRKKKAVAKDVPDGDGVQARNVSPKEPIIIKRPRFGEMKVKINGTTPLLCSAPNGVDLEKCIKGGVLPMPGVQMRYQLYILPGQPEWSPDDITQDLSKFRFGFPGAGLKKSMTRAGWLTQGIYATVTGARISVPEVLIPIISPEPPELFQAYGVNHNKGNALILTSRPRFNEWSMIFKIRYNAEMMPKETVISLLMSAGESIGIGAWRIEKGGIFGAFEVDTECIEISE